MRDILEGIAAARTAGLGVKLNSVVIRGYNDDELVDLVEYGRAAGAEVRFIEYMDVGGATGWSMDQVVSRREILERAGAALRSDRAARAQPDWAPAERFSAARRDHGGCDRLDHGAFLPHLRPGAAHRRRDLAALPVRRDAGSICGRRSGSANSDEEIAARIAATWSARTDRGAEVRAAAPGRGVLHQLESLRADPRREMHTRGG